MYQASCWSLQLLFVAGVVACGEPSASTGESCSLSPGELAISELMSAPVGDNPVEWIELYNPTPQTVVLDRAVVSVESAAVQQHELRGIGALAAHAYVVLGSANPEAQYVNYNYGNDLSLNNDHATLRIGCQGIVIDSVTYGAPPGPAAPSASYSLGFEGGLTPDAAINDKRQAWCAGIEAYDEVNHGTPGTANPVCGALVCVDGVRVRAVRPPAAGDLVISEVFAKSGLASVMGGGRDWIEVWVSGTGPFDLNGMTITATRVGSDSRASFVITSSSCVTVATGNYVVFGAADDAELSGTVSAQALDPGLSLANDTALGIELAVGDVVIDSAQVPAARAGKSASLRPDMMTAVGNDAPESFCYSEATGFFDERGTPGQANLCGALCLDGGRQRPTREAQLGDIVLNEIFPNPTGADLGRDWVEIYVATAVDLNGVAVTTLSPGGATGSWTLGGKPTDACVPLLPDTYVVIGGVNAATLGVSAVATMGSGSDALLPANPITVGDIGLQLLLGNLVLDQVYYPQVDNPTRPLLEGRSFARDPATLQAGPQAGLWCVTTTTQTGFAGTRGSPGQANPDACSITYP